MDFDFSEDQQLLKTTAKEFLENRCPPTLVRETESAGGNFSRELWSSIAEMGWAGVAIPEQYGGNGGSFLDLAVLVEELGRVIAPVPFVDHTVAALVIDEFGSDSQKQRWLPRLATGEAIASVALAETTFSQEPEGIQLSARQDGSDYVLSGTKILVRNGDAADVLLVVARTGTGDDGLGMFVVEADSSGVERKPQRTIDGYSTADVQFSSVRVPAESLIALGRAAFDRLMLLGAVTECFWMVGSSQAVLDMSVEYAKQRVQFDHPIGSFQAVQHRLANMAGQVDAARYMTYQAGWAVSTGLPSAREVRMAKIWVNEGYRKVYFDGHQVHGANGFTAEHDLQLYSRRAKLSELAYGDTATHKRALAPVLGF